jgi:hypothetical protein
MHRTTISPGLKKGKTNHLRQPYSAGIVAGVDTRKLFRDRIMDAEAQGGFDSVSIAESGQEIKAAAMPLGMMECGAVRRTMHCPPCPACSLISSIHVYGGFCPRFDTALGIGMSQKVGIHETAVSRSPYHFITHTYSTTTHKSCFQKLCDNSVDRTST